MNKYPTIHMSKLKVGDQWRIIREGNDRFVIAVEDDFINYIVSGSPHIHTWFKPRFCDVFLIKSFAEEQIIKSWLAGKRDDDVYNLGAEEGFSA